MGTVFEAISEEFESDLQSVMGVIGRLAVAGSSGRERIVGSNAAALFLSALFEEYVRQMAREAARFVVDRSKGPANLPKGFKAALWRRTCQILQEFDAEKNESSGRLDVSNTFARAVDFYSGRMATDIFDQLIHNENNMRSKQLNILFSISGLKNTCSECANCEVLLEYFGESSGERVSGLVVAKLDKLIERRNMIAHSLDLNRSDAPAEIENDIKFLSAFNNALLIVVHAHVFAGTTTSTNQGWLLRS